MTDGHARALTVVQLEALRRRLLRKGGEVNDDLTRLLAGAAIDATSLVARRPGETPTERLRRFLDLIDERLRACRAGVYGACDTCSSDIPYAELDAVPWQTTCNQCAVAPSVPER